MAEIDLLKNSSFESKMDSVVEALLRGSNYYYDQLIGKPKVNGVVLLGDKSSTDLGLMSATDIETIDIDFSRYFE